MKRSTFLSITGTIPVLLGIFILSAPDIFLQHVKAATVNDTAIVMARAVGVLLVSVGVLNFLIRNAPDSPTLKSVLIADIILQLGLIPSDTIAYINGVYTTMGAFVPNTLLHITLILGFTYYLTKMQHISTKL